MENDDNLSPNDELHIASMLKAAGKREIVPDHLKQQWSLHFRQQLNLAAQHRQQRKQRWLTTCASITAAVVICLFAFRQPATENIISAVRVAGTSTQILDTGEKKTIMQGQTLTPSSILYTEKMSTLSINYHHFDLRLNTNTRLQINNDRLILLTGEIYVRSTEKSTSGTLIIETSIATIQDIGTQFSVSFKNNTVISTVREGSIIVESDNNHTVATVNNHKAQRVTVNHQQEIDVTTVSRSGSEWDWIYTTSPPYQLEGKSVYDFLHWSTQETGLTLNFADERAELYARTTLLHGNIPNLHPQTAVNPVLATTHLKARTDQSGLMLIQLQNKH